MKQHLRKYRLIFSIFFLFLTFFSCQKNPVVIDQGYGSAELDSIDVWIKMAKNMDHTVDRRKQAVQRAYHLANGLKEDSLKTKKLSQISLVFLHLPDSLMFQKVNSETLQLAKKTNDSVAIAVTHWDLATFFKRKVIADSAYYHYAEAQKIFDLIGNRYNAGRMLYNMAVVQANVKDYTGSEINTIKAIGLLKPLEKHLGLYQCYNNLGIVTQDLKEYDRALDYFNTALDYLNKLDDKQGFEEQLLNNIGVTYREQGQHQKSISYFDQVLNTKNLKAQNVDLYADVLNNYAYGQFKLGNYQNVEIQLNRALQIRDSIGDIAGLSGSHYRLAEFYLLQGDREGALEYAKKAEKFAQQSSNNERLLKTLGLLVRIDEENSLKNSLDYMKLSDSLIQEERKARDKFTRIQFETDEFIAENEVLTRKKQIWTGIALIVFTLGLAVYIIINQRVKNQALRFQQQQQASNQEIFDLMLSQKQKIEDTKKIEQKRISEELHDGVLGKMLGARMVLTGLNKRTNEEAVAERAIAISALKDVEGEVRAISHELSHAAYQNINNFIISIKDLLQSVGNANGVELAFDYDESFDWDSMKGETKINLYRIIQETLQNAVKHSECKKILVSFVRANNLLNVTITDDGIGFKGKAGKKGIGMRNIESRIGKLNGTWDINSVVDMGTTITFYIPLKDYVEHPKIAVEGQN